MEDLLICLTPAQLERIKRLLSALASDNPDKAVGICLALETVINNSGR